MARKKKILVVDNETDQLYIMEEVLKRLGYDPLVSDDADHAMNLIQANQFDLVIIDLIMPEIDGTELCEQIKTDHPKAKVYAFSGHADLYGPKKLERAGFDGVLRKPLSIDKLSKAVKKIFN